MNRWSLVMICFVALSLLSAECQKDNIQPNLFGDNPVFIFGTSYGHCMGNCVNLYKIVDGKIYPDLLDRGNPADATFSEMPLSDVDYQLALPVMAQFPEALWEAKSPIGCPDCADQGAYFIQVEKEGEVFQWLIDRDEEKLPEYLKPYTKLMGKVVNDLRE